MRWFLEGKVRERRRCVFRSQFFSSLEFLIPFAPPEQEDRVKSPKTKMIVVSITHSIFFIAREAQTPLCIPTDTKKKIWHINDHSFMISSRKEATTSYPHDPRTLDYTNLTYRSIFFILMMLDSQISMVLHVMMGGQQGVISWPRSRSLPSLLDFFNDESSLLEVWLTFEAYNSLVVSTQLRGKFFHFWWLIASQVLEECWPGREANHTVWLITIPKAIGGRLIMLRNAQRVRKLRL